MEELRTYWEVPAVAHFCSLFRAVFKLIDFDIEDLEDALIVDTESAAEGGRSSLIVDVLTALLRGCLGRRDVTLLNYNQFLHELLSVRWVKGGFGCNPLGEDRERACFHILPLYAKVKLLHCLCEWRLERPDVEVLTRDLNGDSLRVVPLGHDQKGATYWYFYGTRLYREDPVVQSKPSKKSRGNGQDAKSTPNTSGRSRRKRRRRNYDFSVSKKSKSPKKRQRSRSTSVDSTSVTESVSDKKRAKADEKLAQDDSASRETGTPSQTKRVKENNEDEDDEDIAMEDESNVPTRYWKPKLEPDLPTENACASSSFPATPASAYSNNTTSLVGVPSSMAQQDDSTSFNDIINRIYSRDEDEEEDDEEKRSNSNFASTVASAPACQSTVVKTESDPGQAATTSETTNDAASSEMKRPFIPDGPPPWDQPELRPIDQSLSGWSLVCSALEDWQKLADSFGEKPKGKSEGDLCEVLRRDFLPAMKDLFDQKEKERSNKLAELAPRRTSDRLEVKRLQKEREEKILAEREREERGRLAKVDEERQRRLEQEKREQRVRLRELEKEKRNLIKERAREERGRRLELRQMRQQLIAEGKSIPEDLLNATGGANLANDQELNELDIEIELEHMYGQLEKLLDQVKESEEAKPFLEAVTEDIAPNYSNVIEKPMDFTKMEDKLLYREYKNKAEFVEDVNLILLNCLQYNGLQSEYTKVAQRLERVFIKAWKRFFPPADLEDSGEDARQEELHCISLLGALDKKIKEDVVRVEMEEKNKFVIDKKELSRQRKREADRRRRRLKAEAKRAQQASDKEKLASQSLSSLSPASIGFSPKRQQQPAPFLVGRSNMRRPSIPPSMPARGPGGRFLPAAPRDHERQQQARTGRSLIAAPSPPSGSSGGLTTYMPGISSGPRLQTFRGVPFTKRLLLGQTSAGGTSRLIPPAVGGQQMAPITVHSTGGAQTKVIKVSDVGMLSSYQQPLTSQPKSDNASVAGISGVVASNGSGGLARITSVAPKRDHLSMLASGNAFLLNTGDGARLVRLVTQDGQQVVASGMTTSRVIPAKASSLIAASSAVAGSNTNTGSAAATPPNASPGPLCTSTPVASSSKPSLHPSGAAAATATAKGAKEAVVTLSSKNVMVSIKDKLAYFTKKDETTGEYKTVGPVDKETLVRKLQVYQQQSKGQQEDGQSDASSSTSTAVAPKPVCSVAPVRQPPQQAQTAGGTLGITAATSTQVVRPVLHATPKAVGTFGGQTVLVSGGQQFVLLPSQQPQVITIAGGGSYILTSNQTGSATSGPAPIYLAASASTTTAHAETNTHATGAPGVQLIQVVPQIILNSTAPASSQSQLARRPSSQQQHVQVPAGATGSVTSDATGAGADVKNEADGS